MSIGIKCSFVSEDGQVQTYVYQGSEHWTAEGDNKELITKLNDIEIKLFGDLPYYSFSAGFIHIDGHITTQYGGTHYKYKIPNGVESIIISGEVTVDINSTWAVYQLRKSGTIVKAQVATQKVYSSHKVDVSIADEIWIIEQKKDGVTGPFDVKVNPNALSEKIKLLELESLKLKSDDTTNILNITDENGYILAYFDSSGYLVAKLRENNKWAGKKWYAYGTSITSVSQGKYVQHLADISGLLVTNKGIPGGGITDLGGYSSGQVLKAIMTLDDGKKEADLITIEVGANEGGPIGTKFDTDKSSFCGCLNMCIRYLQENTDAQIVIMPSVSLTDEPQTKQEFYNRLSVIKDICEINRVYYISGDCGLGWARIKGDDKKYTSDNIHQTSLGGKILAEHMWSILKNIPNF